MVKESYDMSLVKKIFRNRESTIIALLLAILIILVFPYALKLPSFISMKYEQIQEEKRRKLAMEKSAKIYKENERRKTLFQKYQITILSEDYPCNIIGGCGVIYKIPEVILNYYFGELIDKKLHETTQCKKDSRGKYIRNCPGQSFGICPFEFSWTSEELFAKKGDKLSQKTVQIKSLSDELKKQGYTGPTDGYIYYNNELYSTGLCGRLNLLQNTTVIRDFQIELPTIRQLIEENKNDPFVQELANSSLKNYDILINGLTQSINPNNDTSYFSLLMQTIVSKQYLDVTGDGKPELLYITTGEGCGSCRQNWIYVFSANQKLFEMNADDVQLNALPTGNGFTVKQPIRKDNEPLCCPTEYKTDRYLWNGKTFINDTIACGDGKSLINTDRAVEIVKELPEVRSYLLESSVGSVSPIVSVDNKDELNDSNWSVHVWQGAKDSKSITTTFNWYTIDKCTGSIKCSFSKYDKQGNLTGVSSESEYPCK